MSITDAMACDSILSIFNMKLARGAARRSSKLAEAFEDTGTEKAQDLVTGALRGRSIQSRVSVASLNMLPTGLRQDSDTPRCILFYYNLDRESKLFGELS